MKTIIATCDFSPVSVNAARFAVDMAMAINANILLFNAYHIPVAYTGEVPLVLLSLDDLRKESESQLEDLKKEVISITSGKIEVKYEARMGETVDKLEEICKEVKPFAVVMGTKGKSGIEKALFGSTTLTAIRHLTWPVICVPPGKGYGKGFKKIGFACDFRQVSTTTPVNFIKEMVKTFSADLHILNVAYRERHFNPGTPTELFYVHSLLDDVNPEYHFIDHPDVEDGILEFARINNLDLIITIPKKHKLLEGIFKPSSTKQLVFQSHIPLLSIHE